MLLLAFDASYRDRANRAGLKHYVSSSDRSRCRSPVEVRVRVRAAAVNRADLLQRMGMYPPPPGAHPTFLGWSLPARSRRSMGRRRAARVGDRRVRARRRRRLRRSIWSRTSARSRRFPTACRSKKRRPSPKRSSPRYDAMVDRGGFRGGDTILVTPSAAASAPPQSSSVARSAATVVGTARTADKNRALQGARARHRRRARRRRFAGKSTRRRSHRRARRRRVPRRGPARDPAARHDRARRHARRRRRPSSTWSMLMRKRATIVGTMLRSRPTRAEARRDARVRGATSCRCSRAAASSRSSTRCMPLADAAEGARAMASNAGFGKIVLSV